MKFQHSAAIWSAFPGLVPGVLSVDGVNAEGDAGAVITPHLERARERLLQMPESLFPEVQAWRKTFAAMGLKPTQYRSASESLLRRLRKDDELPRIHPLIDLCNAVSVAFAVPVAVFDRSGIAGDLTVRHATGPEEYVTFGGDTEHPGADEVIFADSEGFAHARRWCNRQSGRSSVHPGTSNALIVTEAMHGDAAGDMQQILAALASGIAEVWNLPSDTRILTAIDPVFTV